MSTWMKWMVSIGVMAGCLFSTTDAANWKMVQQGNNEGTYEESVTEFVDLDSIQEVDKNTKKVWVRLFFRDDRQEKILMSFTKDGKMKMLDATVGEDNLPGDSSGPVEWENVVPDSYWEKAYNEVWKVKDRKETKKKEPNRWERKGEDTVDRVLNRVIDKAIWRI